MKVYVISFRHNDEDRVIDKVIRIGSDAEQYAHELSEDIDCEVDVQEFTVSE